MRFIVFILLAILAIVSQASWPPGGFPGIGLGGSFARGHGPCPLGFTRGGDGYCRRVVGIRRL